MDLIDISLYASYILMVVSFMAAVLAPIFKAIDDPDSIKKSMISFGIILGVFLVCFLLSDSTSKGVSPLVSKVIGASIFSTYIFGVLAIGGIIYFEISNALK